MKVYIEKSPFDPSFYVQIIVHELGVSFERVRKIYVGGQSLGLVSVSVWGVYGHAGNITVSVEAARTLIAEFKTCGLDCDADLFEVSSEQINGGLVNGYQRYKRII